MARGTAKNGRSKGDAHHARFYRWELDSPAFRSLSCPARCLLLEFKALYNGANNGRLGMGIRQAARLLNRSPGHMQEVFEELQDRGFIKLRQIGTSPNGQGAAERLQSEWSLTEYEYSGQPATKDFMKWEPAKNKSPYPSGNTSFPQGTLERRRQI